MASIEHEDNQAFENEVRRIARHRWPAAQYAGASIIDGRERDGVFETEDCVHLVEATVSQSKKKAIDDMKKIAQLARSYQEKYPNKAVKGWFVTKNEPTAEQRDAAKPFHHLIHPLSLSQFQSALIDVGAYFDARDHYSFGSVRDPSTGSPDPSSPYVPLDLLEVDSDRLWSINDLCSRIATGDRFLLLGDYGVGKSMTLRELYRGLKRDYQTDKTVQFPVYINLRDHIGQSNTAEILERHARNIGFSNHGHLVRAWRAGFVILILDGFDEMSSLGIQGIWRNLRDIRYGSMQPIRDFIRNSPVGVGLILAGRTHFFNSPLERDRACGISSAFRQLSLSDFTTEQIQRYLKNCGLPVVVPSWLPSRPLLVGYLAAHGILSSLLSENSGEESKHIDPAHGWDLILEKVCEREARMEVGVDGLTVRRILERLATFSRASTSALGPLTEDQVAQAFSEICGYKPDEKHFIMLQRLPGLGVDRREDTTRSFVDEDFADACRAGDVVQYFIDPYSPAPENFSRAEWGLGALGVCIVALKCRKEVTTKALDAVIQRASEQYDGGCLMIDLIRAALMMGSSVSSSIHIAGVSVPDLEFFAGMGDFSKVSFDNCYFTRVDIDPNVNDDALPAFRSCYLGELDGRVSKDDLPPGRFDSDCVIDRFAEAVGTSNAIVQLDLPLGTRVLLTVLRKLYFQSGSGRLESAFYRGLDHNAQRLVPVLLKSLESANLALPYHRGGLPTTIWRPDRAQMNRVGKILASPHSCDDPVVVASRQVS